MSFKKFEVAYRGRGFTAYGPFVAPNNSSYYLVQCGFACGFQDDFVMSQEVVGLSDGDEFYPLGRLTPICYSFAMAVIDLAWAAEVQP